MDVLNCFTRIGRGAMVQEYGGGPIPVYNGIVYFSSLANGRVYRAGVKGETPEPITPGAFAILAADKSYRYSALIPHPTSPHLLASILEDHNNPLPAEVQTTLVTINTTTKAVHPLVKGAISMEPYQSIEERGGVVEYKLHAGEGHGWRQEPNMRNAYEWELGFYESSRIKKLNVILTSTYVSSIR
ncbi:hypothetical protein BJ165DRAFT_1562540 [Panaeolus papilionaceus]|nr:hypothetical protein BJ165DRAFT_1562540 [Panaeolus papilionaceus]